MESCARVLLFRAHIHVETVVQEGGSSSYASYSVWARAGPVLSNGLLLGIDLAAPETRRRAIGLLRENH